MPHHGLTPVAAMLAQAVLAADEPSADQPAVDAVPASEDPAINPYKAKRGLTTAQLVAYIERAMDRPKSIQSRPGFTEAVAEACATAGAVRAQSQVHRGRGHAKRREQRTDGIRTERRPHPGNCRAS